MAPRTRDYFLKIDPPVGFASLDFLDVQSLEFLSAAFRWVAGDVEPSMPECAERLPSLPPDRYPLPGTPFDGPAHDFNPGEVG